jgi:PGF-CTERM protein
MASTRFTLVVLSLAVAVSLGAVGVVSVGATSQGGLAGDQPHYHPNNNGNVLNMRVSNHLPGNDTTSRYYETVAGGADDSFYRTRDGRKRWFILRKVISFTPWADDCQLGNLESIGLDPDNSHEGQPQGGEDEESVLQYVESSGNTYYNDEARKIKRNMGIGGVPVSGPNTDFDYIQGGGATTFNTGDSAAASLNYTSPARVWVLQDGCFANPTEAGWYRQIVVDTIKKTAPGEDRLHDNITIDGQPSYASNWVYICDCDSFDEAVETVGPPPEPNSYEKNWSTTPTPTRAPSGTDTPEPTETATATEGQETATATPTPTDTGQPGFGAVAALLALTAAALLARRTR